MADTPAPKADEPVSVNVPERLRWLGEALKPVLERVELHLEAPPVEYSPPFKTPGISHTLPPLFRQIADSLGELETAIQKMNVESVLNEQADPATVRRSVLRLDSACFPILAGLQTCRRLGRGGAESDGWWLASQVITHLLETIRGWMADLVMATLDPAAFVRKRGMTPIDGMQAELVLELTASPQLAQLDAWMKAHNGIALIAGTLLIRLICWSLTFWLGWLLVGKLLG